MTTTARYHVVHTGHPHATRSLPINEILADLSEALPITSLSIIGHRQQPVSHPPAPLSGSSEIGGVRAGARESPGKPLGRPPSQGPPRRVVPDEAAMRWSRTSPFPRLRHPLG